MTLAVIGGTSITQLKNFRVKKKHHISTDWGDPAEEVTEADFNNATIFFINRHGTRNPKPPHKINYRANLSALKTLGATKIIGTAAVGGITVDTGKLVIPHQIIDYTYGRKTTYFEDSDSDLIHIDFTNPFDESFRRKIIEIATKSNIPIERNGVYGVTQGPRLETASEIKKLERDGCDIVGMTAMPEACLARELQIPYLTLAVVVNAAAGKTSEIITIAKIQENVTYASPKIDSLIKSFLTNYR